MERIEMNRAERRRRAKEDEKILARGIDPEAQGPEQTAAMARQLHALLEEAKRERSIDPPVRYLHARIDATLRQLASIPVACKKGCSHCCHGWVSASAPEVLFVAKAVRRRSDPTVVGRIRTAFEITRDVEQAARSKHPHPCPLLENDACSLYAIRPGSCRFWASADAGICARAYHGISDEDIPAPRLNLVGRNAYAIALAAALKHAGLPHHLYEFNAALARAVERENAEREWLAGIDIFADVKRDPNDIFAGAPAHMMYSLAFGA
ncbi:MAG TPA: YkgJ family cysteine cluster protein [Xanthobacteraceae bacterium]|nr:YkgJ family cysteine cluster protein [Xanthobacteraceae bacterium]